MTKYLSRPPDTPEGATMYEWANDLFPICRSLTGEGVRQTLAYLAEKLPQLKVHEVPSGTQAFDWTVPDEWNIREAWVENEQGQRVIDFADNTLHIVGYSTPVDQVLSLEALQEHLYSIPEMPEAIPYLTSYYRQDWGFCLSQNARDNLRPGKYRVHIDSTLKPGSLTYGEIFIPGDSKSEVFFSTYICHPSMANDQLSGPVVLTALAQWLASIHTKLSYRIVFVPENIGSLVYLSRHLNDLKETVTAGFNIACVGDERNWTMMTSRTGDTLSDRVLKHVLTHEVDQFLEFDYLWPNRGSDERNYCMPGIDLPVSSFHRTKYGEYPEYHTSLDNMDLITPDGLADSLSLLTRVVTILENNHVWKISNLGEPQLGKRGLYPSGGNHRAGHERQLSTMMNLLAYCDGSRDLISVSERIGEYAMNCIPILERLAEENLVTKHQT